MVNRINQLYTGPSGPVTPSNKPTHETHAKQEESSLPVSKNSIPVAARLIPHLKDTIEISEAGRAAASIEEAEGAEEGIAETHRTAISKGWYSAGYLAALEQVENA